MSYQQELCEASIAQDKARIARGYYAEDTDEIRRKQWFSERKQHPLFGFWCRLEDCNIAEEVYDYRWVDLPSEFTDRCGNKFDKVLCPKDRLVTIGDSWQFILSPDWFVPEISKQIKEKK